MKIDGAQARIRTYAPGAAALGANAAILADTAMANGATTAVAVFAGQPDVPRSLTVKGNDANVAGNVTIEGTDIEDKAISEVIALNGANVVNGNKAFKTVTEITLPARCGPMQRHSNELKSRSSTVMLHPQQSRSLPFA